MKDIHFDPEIQHENDSGIPNGRPALLHVVYADWLLFSVMVLVMVLPGCR
jgi:hypothetical protein